MKGAYWNHGSFARRTKQQVIQLQQKATTLLLNSKRFCYLCSTAKRGSTPSSKGFCYTASPSWFRRFISSMSVSAGSGNQGTCGSWLVWTCCLVLFLVQVSAIFEWESWVMACTIVSGSTKLAILQDFAVRTQRVKICISAIKSYALP